MAGKHQPGFETTDKKAPLEKVFSKVMTPFEEFIHHETTAGLLLMGCAVIALVIANSPLAYSYSHLLHTHVTFGFGDFVLDKTLHHWINDGLMTLFFFVVGLEIKREVLAGELSNVRAASVPIVAAIGGMVVPALIYFAINAGSDTAIGWGIPMATDIAFAVGAMVLLGKRVPAALMTFLVALAIVDDLGAVIVIALFYTETIYVQALGISAVIFMLLVALNLSGVRKPAPYFILGVLLWLAMLKSGIHATLAGVLTALTIPSPSKLETTGFSAGVRSLLDRFDQHHRPGTSIMANDNQRSVLQTIQNGVHLVESPLQRLEHSMHMPVAFFIIPIFALANAGVPIELAGLQETLAHPVTMGVMLGLIVGKVVGVAGFTWVALRLGVGELPRGVSFAHIIGAALLAGIGFTMSIFIAELGFAGNAEYLLLAKTGVLFASVIAGVAGYLWLLTVSRRTV
ncbi:MAG: Na+/H+ antiporter NhaA [Thiotrichales bacterium]